MLSLEIILFLAWLLPILGVLIIYVTAVRERRRCPTVPLRTEQTHFMQERQRSGALRPLAPEKSALSHDYPLSVCVNTVETLFFRN
jgi:hypothetical protein